MEKEEEDGDEGGDGGGEGGGGPKVPIGSRSSVKYSDPTGSGSTTLTFGGLSLLCLTVYTVVVSRPLQCIRTLLT